MDASTFVAARLNEQRARELARDIAHLSSQAHRRAELGPAAPAPARPRLWITFRRRPAEECDPAGLALAGPSS